MMNNNVNFSPRKGQSSKSSKRHDHMKVTLGLSPEKTTKLKKSSTKNSTPEKTDINSKRKSDFSNTINVAKKQRTETTTKLQSQHINKKVSPESKKQTKNPNQPEECKLSMNIQEEKENQDFLSDDDSFILNCADALSPSKLIDSNLKKTETSPFKERNPKPLNTIDPELLFSSNSQTEDENKLPGRFKESKMESSRSNISTFSKFSTTESFETTSEYQLGREATSGFDDFFDDDSFTESVKELVNFQLYKVLKIERKDSETDLTVRRKKEDTGDEIVVHCREIWKNIELKENDLIRIQVHGEGSEWIIDNKQGFIVSHPDLLLSSTTVVNSIYCLRQAILKERFAAICNLPHGFNTASDVMFVGNIVHTLMENTLKQNLFKREEVEKIFDEILSDRETIREMFFSGIIKSECKPKIDHYINQLLEFIEVYVKGTGSTPDQTKFQGKIEQIQDIEENIWLPKIGLKGKIDITAAVKIHKKTKNTMKSNRQIIPIEIKTGKSSSYLEHRAQVILYCIMLSLTGRETDTGVLVYLKDNDTREVTGSHSDYRDLIMLRNNLSKYLKPIDLGRSPSNLKDLYDEVMELPSPIYARGCSWCDFSSICYSYARNDRMDPTAKEEKSLEFAKKFISHLDQEHIDYVLKWIFMLNLENTSEQQDNSHMWKKTPQERELRKTCLHNLKSTEEVPFKNGKYMHTLIRDPKIMESCVYPDFTNSDFSAGEYVVLGTDSNVNISGGIIRNVSATKITISLDKNLNKLYPNANLHLNKYKSANLFTSNLASVAGLLEDNDVCKRLRNIIIDKKPAEFLEDSIPRRLKNDLKNSENLNSCQKRAILQSFACQQFVLIKGMPGTGKTETLVNLIEQFAKENLRILITSHTNSAVDNILLKLLPKKLDFLRIGSSEKIHIDLQERTEYYLTRHCETTEQFQEVYDKYKIVACTCYGTDHGLFQKYSFDYCIVDESSQILQSTVIRPLYASKKFILVGDPEQLPPICKNSIARKMGVNESLFQRLDSAENTVTLSSQYRMNKRIMDLANTVTYKNELQAGNDQVANATFIKFEKKLNPFQGLPKWIQDVLSPDIEKSVVIIDTGYVGDKFFDNDTYKNFSDEDKKCSNPWEASIILQLVETLLRVNIKTEDIGVIAPYKAQVLLLRDFVHQGVEINTVDQYQGRDKSVIFYSCTKNVTFDYQKKEFEILDDHQRLTVAITRAKHKLIILADKDSIEKFTPFAKLFSACKIHNDIIKLTNGENNFLWEDLRKVK